jgi:hypothetical protein
VHNIGVTTRPVSHAVEGREDGVQLGTKNPWLPTTKTVNGYKSYVQSAPKKSAGKTAGTHERDEVS